LDERQGDFLEAAARCFRGKSDVEHDHASGQLPRARELSRRCEGQLGSWLMRKRLAYLAREHRMDPPVA
jgi:hypothetical protein